MDISLEGVMGDYRPVKFQGLKHATSYNILHRIDSLLRCSGYNLCNAAVGWWCAPKHKLPSPIGSTRPCKTSFTFVECGIWKGSYELTHKLPHKRWFRQGKTKRKQRVININSTFWRQIPGIPLLKEFGTPLRHLRLICMPTMTKLHQTKRFTS